MGSPVDGRIAGASNVHQTNTINKLYGVSNIIIIIEENLNQKNRIAATLDSTVGSVVRIRTEYSNSSVAEVLFLDSWEISTGLLSEFCPGHRSRIRPISFPAQDETN